MIVKYMLLIYDDEQAWEKLAETERQRIVGEYMQFTQQIKSTGKYVTGAQLRQTLAATSVRTRDGRRVVTDGPFAETCEQLGGYYVIDARDLDEALDVAAEVPSARVGTVEIRPIVDSFVS